MAENMLKAVLPILVLIGCVRALQLEKYHTIHSYDEFNFKHDVSSIVLCCVKPPPIDLSEISVFPKITDGITNLPTNFIVKPVFTYGIMFSADLGSNPDEVHFSTEDGNFQLVSFWFQFLPKRVTRLHFKFQSPNTDMEYTVTSRVVTVYDDDENAPLEHIRDNAVSAESAMIRVAIDLGCQGGKYERRVSVNDMEWVKDVLTKQPPRLHQTEESGPKSKCYRSLPVVLKDHSLQSIHDSRLRMVEKKQPRPTA